MNISQRFTSHDSIRSLTREELAIGTKILTTNLGLQPSEKVLIVTDPAMLTNEAAVWFEAAKTLTPNVELVVIDGLTHSGQEPSSDLITECTRDGIVIFQTTYSLTHTSASKTARSRGARVASLPGVNSALMLRTLNLDYAPVRDLGTQLSEVLQKSQTITITSAAGTNVTAGIRQSDIIDDNGFIPAGEVGNLPAGETFFSPLEGTVNGTWVVNGSMADDDDLDQPITITIKDGFAVGFTGGQAAQRLRSKLTAIGPAAFEVAEIGIGTNPAASPTASLIEAEKAYGSAHLALGNSASIGGKNTSPIHLDGVTLEPTITLDHEIVLANGKFSFKLKKD